MLRFLLALLLVTPAFAGEVVSFRAIKCGKSHVRATTECTIPNQTGFKPRLYNRVEWPTATRDLPAGRFKDSRWMPVAAGEPPRNVQFAGQLLVLKAIAEEGYTPNYVARIWKNGNHQTSLGATIGVPAPQFRNAFVVPLVFQDVAQPGDTYEVWLHVSHPDAEIDAHPLHTWWSGQ